MATWKQLIYMVLDELKLSADDAYFTEDHCIFLLSKYRGLFLSQQYKDVKKPISESNYQTLCLDLETTPAIAGEECEGGIFLKSKQKIPFTLSIVTPKIYPDNYYIGNITYVSMDRMKYVGYNKWLQNIIYASIGPDNYLYLKSSNPQYLYLQKCKFTGVFEDSEKAAELECTTDSECSLLDKTFHLEEDLIPQVVQAVVKELSGAIYKPKDSDNNAKDDLAELATFIKNNVKSDLQKQIDG